MNSKLYYKICGTEYIFTNLLANNFNGIRPGAVNFAVEQTTKAQKGSRGITVLFL